MFFYSRSIPARATPRNDPYKYSERSRDENPREGILTGGRSESRAILETLTGEIGRIFAPFVLLCPVISVGFLFLRLISVSLGEGNCLLNLTFSSRLRNDSPLSSLGTAAHFGEGRLPGLCSKIALAAADGGNPSTRRPG